MPVLGLIRLSRYDMSCVDLAIAYIDKYYKNCLSAEQISEEVTLNVKKLRAGLKRRTGYTLHDYHFKVRIEKSKELLQQTDYPVRYIAAAVGFKNESHFCQKFKHFVRMTPNEFRNRPEEQSVESLQLCLTP